MSTCLADLPYELLRLILFHVDNGSLSAARLHEEPSATLTHSAIQPLKNFSRTCHQYRALIIQSLFNFCRVHLSESTFSLDKTSTAQYPNYDEIREFLVFLVKHELCGSVKSLVLFTEYDLGWRVPGIMPSAPAGTLPLELGYIWSDVFSVIQPSTVTICVPPSSLAFFTSCGIYVADAWAFEMPLHILQLRMSQDMQEKTTQPSHTNKLFGILPWTHCTLNEGSAIQVYSTYEYHSMVQPSILNGRLRDYADATPRLLNSLRSFDYIAIFPLYGQVVKMLSFLFILPKLECVSMQLAPKRGNKILEDATRILRSLHSDLWMEFENTYFLIATNIVQIETASSVKEFICLDYQQKGLWESLGHGSEIMSEHWRIISDGHWTKIEDSDCP